MALTSSYARARLFLLAAFIMLGCGGSKFGGAPDAKKPESSKDENSGNQSGSADENQGAEQPAVVSGAFLTECSYTDETLPETVANTSAVGCSVLDKRGQKVDKKTCDFVDVSLHEESGAAVDMKTWTVEASAWARLLALPDAYRSVGKLHLQWTCSDKSHDGESWLPTKEIKNAPSVDLGLDSFTEFRIWDGSQVLPAVPGVNPNDFCNNDGTPLTKIVTKNYATSFGSILLEALQGKDWGVTNENKSDETLGSIACFKTFGRLDPDVKDKALVQQNSAATCLLVRDNKDRILAMKADPAHGLNVGNLRSYARSKPCK